MKSMFSAELRALRNKLKLNQTEMAAKLHIDWISYIAAEQDTLGIYGDHVKEAIKRRIAEKWHERVIKIYKRKKQNN